MLGSGSSKISNGKNLLIVTLDLSAAKPGRYFLATRKEGRDKQMKPTTTLCSLRELRVTNVWVNHCGYGVQRRSAVWPEQQSEKNEPSPTRMIYFPQAVWNANLSVADKPST